MDAENGSEQSSNESHSLSKIVGKRKAELEACTICLESISDRAIAVPCNHASFDFLCLVSWVQDHPVCPLCKSPLSAIEYEWASPHDYHTYRIPSPRRKASDDCASNLGFPGRPRIPQHFRQRRKHPRPAPYQTPSEEAALARRRQIHRGLTFSCHVGANRVSQFREFTPQTFSHSKELQLKARKFIRRELQVFDFLTPSMDVGHDQQRQRRYGGSSEFLLEYIVSILKTTDVKDANGKAEKMLAEFFGHERAKLFLHELSSWLRSPYVDLEGWDRHVQYPAAREGQQDAEGRS